MSQDVSGFGLRITLIASVTFPVGVQLSQFADDSDPLDVASQQIATAVMGLNGDLINFKTPNPINAVINLIPQSEDDLALSALADANRVGRGKSGARDVITMSLAYPDSTIITLTEGIITDAPLADSVAGAGRLKSKQYSFSFENRTRA